MSGGLRHFVSATPQRPNTVKLRKSAVIIRGGPLALCARPPPLLTPPPPIFGRDLSTPRGYLPRHNMDPKWLLIYLSGGC